MVKWRSLICCFAGLRHTEQQTVLILSVTNINKSSNLYSVLPTFKNAV